METGLVDIVAAIFSLLVMVAFLRFWKPRRLMEEGDGRAHDRAARATALGAVLKGWSPFVLASVLIFLWALPAFGEYLKIAVPDLPDARAAQRSSSARRRWCRCPTPEPASIDLNFFALPGTAVFLGAFLVAPFLGMSRRRAAAAPRPHLPPARAVDARDQLHGRPRLRHEVRGHGHGARPVA